jgi:cytochrome c-type biogenesis protein CcmH/NrfG
MNQALTLQQLAQQYEAKNELEKAVNCYNKAIESRPNNDKLYIQLARVLKQQDRRQDLVEAYQKAIKLNHQQPFGVYKNLGDALSQEGKLEEAITAYQEALEQQPDHPGIYRILAKFQLQIGDIDEAITNYQKAIQLKLEQPFWVYKNLENILNQQGRLEEIIPVYCQLIEYNANSVKAWQSLGLVYEQQNNLESALSCLIKAQQIELPGQKQIYDKIGDILYKLDRKKDAKACYGVKHQLPVDIIKKYSKLPLNWTVIHKSDPSLSVTYIDIHTASQSILLPPRNLNLNLKANNLILGGLKFTEKEKILFHSETYVALIKDGRVWNKDYTTAVITPENNLLADLSSGSSNLVISSVSKLPLKHHIKGTAICLIPPMWATTNYCHWMLETLPRIQLLHLSGIELDFVDKFILQEVNTSFGRDTLVQLGIPTEKIIKTVEYPYIQADNLIIPSLLPHPANKGSDWIINFLRTNFLTEKSEEKKPKQRLYIHRNQGNRGIVNEAELIIFLDKYGFQIVTLESKSVREQALLLSSAEVVIAPHGAGLTNIVFCRPGTKVIELFSPLYGIPTFWVLASQCGLDYYFLRGEDYDDSMTQILSSTHPDKLQFKKDKLKDIYIDLNNLFQLMKIAGIV